MDTVNGSRPATPVTGSRAGLSATEAAEDIYARVRSCTRCALSKTRTLAVPGEGPLAAEVMLIGEAPGANEDRQGRPFVGQAGQFLQELLAAAGMKRADVYICNVLKCRPPANRDPQLDEIAACRDYLDEQVALIDPLTVITLGRYSMSRYFPQMAISRIHGQFKIIDGRCYVPMYHPAAALHQQNLRDVILNDFRAVPGILERARAKRTAVEPQPSEQKAPSAPTAVQAPLFE